MYRTIFKQRREERNYEFEYAFQYRFFYCAGHNFVMFINRIFADKRLNSIPFTSAPGVPSFEGLTLQVKLHLGRFSFIPPGYAL